MSPADPHDARGADGAADPDVVRAAGGLVVRATPHGRQVLVVHRPRYDDWSFPKGKQDPGETDEETALREVAEETGVVCQLGQPLGEVRYRDHRGRPKVVRYWVMEPLPGGDEPRLPDHEVDEVHWCSPAHAATLLSYAHDRALLGRLEGQFQEDST